MTGIVKTLHNMSVESVLSAGLLSGEPVLLKGLVAEWPCVRASMAGHAKIAQYLSERATAAPVPFSAASPEIQGCFHYAEDLQGLNFQRAEAPLAIIIDQLMKFAELESPPSLAAQGIVIQSVLPAFAAENPMPLLPAQTVSRLWIGNAAKVATHNDPSDNIACVVAGRRRFTLFPPEQLPNLYMGPFDPTPAGTPISMVHVTNPDLDRYPRFAQAMNAAVIADMEPGDALYIPYQWFHHVEAFDAINILVNYWWNPARTDLGSPWDVLMHGMMSLRHLPEDQRRAWKAAFDHYVFETHGKAGAHLPEFFRGVLDADRPEDIVAMRRNLIASLVRVEKER